MSKLPFPILKEKLVFLGALVFCTLYVNHAIARQWGLSTHSFQKETITDSLPQHSGQSMKIHKIENGEDIQMSFENGQLTELKINGKNIPQEEFDDYRDKTDGIVPRLKSGHSSPFNIFEDSGESLSQVWGAEWKNLDSLLIEFSGPAIEFFRSPENWQGMEQLNDDFWNEHLQKMKEFFNSEDFGLVELDTFFRFQFKDFPYLDNNHIQEGDEQYSLPLIQEGNFTEILGEHLNRDELLIPGKVNHIELTGKYLKINGERQPSNIWNKYKRIFEESSGTQLEKNSKIVFDFKGVAPKRKYRNL